MPRRIRLQAEVEARPLALWVARLALQGARLALREAWLALREAPPAQRGAHLVPLGLREAINAPDNALTVASDAKWSKIASA